MNTQPTVLPVRDCITGEPVAVWPHDAHPDLGGGHHVLLGTGTGEDLWLTPTAARQLAAQLLDAADTITTTTEGTTPCSTPK